MNARPNAANALKSEPPPASGRRPAARIRVMTIDIAENQLTCTDPKEAIDVPGGFRLHVTYTGGKVKICLQGARTEAWVDGVVISGADWIQIREDGVAVFDARLTLARSTQDNTLNVDEPANRNFVTGRPPTPDDFVMYAIIEGVADLGVSAGASGQLDSERWTKEGGSIPVVLPVRFEASGPAVNWGSPRFRALANNYPKYARLVRNQCIAEGDVTVRDGRVVSVYLDIYMYRRDKA